MPTVQDRREILQRGADILASVFIPHGFQFGIVSSGSSSGGAFAQGEFVRGDRRIELHFRFSLGLVAYHIGSFSLAHSDYMRALLGRPCGTHYPGFSDEPLVQFEALRQDLVEHCSDFFAGTGDQFRQCVERHRHYESLSPLQKMEFGVA